MTVHGFLQEKKKHIDNDMIDELDDETLSTGFEDEEDIAFRI